MKPKDYAKFMTEQAKKNKLYSMSDLAMQKLKGMLKDKKSPEEIAKFIQKQYHVTDVKSYNSFVEKTPKFFKLKSFNKTDIALRKLIKHPIV